MTLHLLEFIDFTNGIQVSNESYGSTTQNLIMNPIMAEKKLRSGTMIAQTRRDIEPMLIVQSVIASIQYEKM